MTARSQMTMRALVERLGEGTTDDSGNTLPGSATWATLTEDMPCLLYSSAGREAVTEDRTVAVVDLKLMAPKSAAVTTDDRIAGITDRLGDAVFSGVARIEAVLRKRTHLELSLTRVDS